jgi:uncharacterized protein YcbK (DUF882 family)
MPPLTRRRFALQAAAALAAPFLLGTNEADADTLQGRRRLVLFNPHTKERWKGTYARGGKVSANALDDLNAFARDWRADVTGGIDVGAWDTLWAIRKALGTTKPTSILSGWRTPATNRLLRGTASDSLHLRGKALDLGQDDRTLEDLHRAALALSPGGVGLYTRQRFVHIDTGPRRQWGS